MSTARCEHEQDFPGGRFRCMAEAGHAGAHEFPPSPGYRPLPEPITPSLDIETLIASIPQAQTTPPDPARPKLVVRIKTSHWCDNRGLHTKRSIIPMKRLSGECHDFLSEDASMIGVDDVLPRIQNLAQCQDGLYEVEIVNETRDWESGTVEDWDYFLIPL